MGLILAAFFAVVVMILSILFITLEIYVGVIGGIKGAPFVRSRPDRIATMIELASIKQGTRVVDLGSGDGSILIAAAKQGAIATGIEMNPFLIPYTRWRARRAGMQERVTVIKGELKNYSLHHADVVFLYLLPRLMATIHPKLFSELKPGARVVSNGFPFLGRKPTIQKNGVFLYHIS